MSCLVLLAFPACSHVVTRNILKHIKCSTTLSFILYHYYNNNNKSKLLFDELFDVTAFSCRLKCYCDKKYSGTYQMLTDFVIHLYHYYKIK